MINYLFELKDLKSEVLNNFYSDVNLPLIGYSISFPDKLDVSLEYYLNEQAQKEGLDIEDDEEDELY